MSDLKKENDIVSISYSGDKNKKDEIQKIKNKYVENRELSNQEKIKMLDASTTKRATKNALIVGIISSLILGTGMSILMLGNAFFIGLIIGLIGLGGTIYAYPLYQKQVKEDKDKVRKEILELCDKEIL